MPAVSVKGISKKYRIFPSGQARLKETLSFGRKRYGHDFWALQDVNLEVEPGTTLGILGRNGAGKSTLLSIISGILQPTSGTVEVNGRLIALSTMGVGFNKEYTGRENIMLNGLILGMERQEILERFDDIEAFADIGEFMNQPIKTYSSGMRSRLAFAVASNLEPDILILDEVLAVGDAVYKELALQKMYDLRDSGTTILFVSHSMSMVESFCNEAVLLHKGRVLATGETAEVIGQYQDLVSSMRAQKKEQRTADAQPPDQAVVAEEEGPEETSEEAREGLTFEGAPAFERRVAHLRKGTGEARIQGVELLDKRLRPVEAVTSGSTVTVRVYLEYLEAVKDSNLLIALHDEASPGQPERQESQFYGPNLGYVLELYERYKENPASVDEQSRGYFETWNPPRPESNGHTPASAGKLFSASTALEGGLPKEMDKGGRVVVDFTFEVPLRKGRYSIGAAVRAAGKKRPLDRLDVATIFRIKGSREHRPLQGILHVPTEIKARVPEGERQDRSS